MNYNEFLRNQRQKRETQTSVLMETEDSDTEQISNIVQLLWASPARLTQNPTLKVLNTQIRA